MKKNPSNRVRRRKISFENQISQTDIDIIDYASTLSKCQNTSEKEMWMSDDNIFHLAEWSEGHLDCTIFDIKFFFLLVYLLRLFSTLRVDEGHFIKIVETQKVCYRTFAANTRLTCWNECLQPYHKIKRSNISCYQFIRFVIISDERFNCIDDDTKLPAIESFPIFFFCASNLFNLFIDIDIFRLHDVIETFAMADVTFVVSAKCSISWKKYFDGFIYK